MTKQIIKSNSLYLWCETFGERSDTSILLIQGSGAQGILWHEPFCQSLAQSGYYVIRYDHRDTGQSSHIDYNNNPYTLIDLMEDAKGILDIFNVQKAHIVGSSMGGYIAQNLGTHCSDRVLTLTLMMTSPLSITLEHAFLEESKMSSLPLPTKQFMNSLLHIGTIPQTQEGLINYLLSIWSAYNGTAVPYDKLYWRSLATMWIGRAKSLSASYNHRMAVNSSPLSREYELRSLNLPTLIIHGSLDPFFPIEHAYALQKAITLSSLVVIKDMGHFFHGSFRKEVLSAILLHLKKNDV